MNKLVKTLVILLIPISIVVIFFFWFYPPNTPQQTVTPTFPGTSTTSDQLTIHGNGILINTNDFLNNGNAEEVEGSLGESYQLDTTDTSYSIFYSQSDETFTISLLETPLEQSREQAQNHLLALLGISKEQLCRLKTVVSVPYWLNERLAGQNLGISYCIGSVNLRGY